ncbi:hypothetical protein V5O48_012272 [Marasmius crinis-equi]|uniref:DUF6534 domain-containing protein n=1 Tax=Marasmius crinis-equi TaxID=585013 RepID=A0ABR3F3B0_9AGAR
MSGGNVDSDSSDVELRELTDTPLFLGYIISFFLQGVLVVQVFAYFIAFKRDQMYIKLAVWFVFLLEWVSTVISTVAALECLPLSGRLAGLTTSILFKLLSPACGLVILVVHAFYCYRIHLLGAHVMVPIIIFTLSIGQCVMVSIAGLMSVPEAENTRLHDALLGASFVVRETPPIQYFAEPHSQFQAWLSLAAAGDCLIAVALMLLLTRASRNLSTVAAKTRVQRAMMICVETGSITGLATLLELALYLVFMQSFIHVVLFYMLSKL